ncbi:transporter [Chitinophaga caeni]|uniref:Transporter n=1 Tax=Chitinophaga caeni TaxID=2029983 RepID=A0A291QVJ9_9BACT|nr:TolB family protein [Chitinophaga caeni]ATL47884.1 transporter [Chitinophaga caeni]
MKHLLFSVACIMSCSLPLQFLMAQQKIISILETVEVSSGQRTVLCRDTSHFEAPNWSRDGKYLLLNKAGKLYQFQIDSKQWNTLPFGAGLKANNDHGFSPNGELLAISSGIVEKDDPAFGKGSVIYIADAQGGNLRRITSLSPSYWHGWSPDGKTLAFVGQRNGEFDIYSIPASGGTEKRLTNTPGLDDGPDYSPDGKYIYYNSYRSGKMEIWRMEADGSNAEQLTDDGYANWFPHPSPDGKQLVFLSFMEDQGQDHPFGKDVRLRIIDLETGETRNLTGIFFGGQGSINVPSWSPDSRYVAFVRYEVIK